MCRSIRPLFNFEPVATDAEIGAAALQFARKLSGFTHPSRANKAAFTRAVNDISGAARELINSLVTPSAPANRDEWAARAKARAARRFTARARSADEQTLA